MMIMEIQGRMQQLRSAATLLIYAILYDFFFHQIFVTLFSIILFVIVHTSIGRFAFFRSFVRAIVTIEAFEGCLLYTSDAADDTPCVDLGGRRIIQKNNHQQDVYD
eukprot:TRINITY_DN28639_c0_g1_i1.p2 TRINITY_DN28639_c0_g1~~TRINITY_DN28639_c0_g1_i1.p2  ORF type:complete len:106 (-),score=14.85 TRINITY_DN28639_c0_g1_i1:27-344(-)